MVSLLGYQIVHLADGDGGFRTCSLLFRIVHSLYVALYRMLFKL